MGAADRPDVDPEDVRPRPVGADAAAAADHRQRARVHACWCATRCSAGSSSRPGGLEALGELDGEDGWDAPRWREAMAAYFAEYDDVGIGPTARNPRCSWSTRHRRRWHVRQIIDDPEGDRDWGITAQVDLAESDEIGEAAVTILDVGPT